MPTTTWTPLDSPLLALPGEIRNAIYHLLLVLDNTPATSPGQRAIQSKTSSTLAPALLSTCRQIHAEATPILYTLNTFTAHPSLLSSFPHLIHPSRPIGNASVTKRIVRWTITVRLDVDPRFSEEAATAAFTGAEVLTIRATEPAWRSAGNAALMLFQGVRGVGKARVEGSVDREFAEWLEERMMRKVELRQGQEEEEVAPPGMVRKMVWVQAR